jgi:hypothetical protein
MTYEKGLFAQADPGIVSGSTIERNKMSTKTSFKRIALVAVTALGAGVLSVAPASAALTGGTQVVTYTAPGSAGTSTAATVAGVIGTPLSITVTNTFAGNTATDTAADLPVLTGTAVTAGSAVTVANSTHAVVSTSGTSTQIITAGSAAFVLGQAATVGVRTLTFTPDLAGTYIFTSATAGTITTGGAITVTVASTGPVITSTGGTSNVSGVKATVNGVGNGASFITLRVQANALDTAYIVSTSGVGSLYGTAPIVTGIAGGSTPVLNTTGTIAGGFAVPKGAVLPSVTQYVVSDAFTFNATSAVGGTQVITVTPVGSTTPPSTMTITWGVAPIVGVASAGNSTSILSTDILTPFVGTTDEVISAPNTANARAATIRVVLNDTQATPAVIASKAVTATVTGSGLIGGSIGTGTTLAYTDATVTGTVGRSITVNTDALGQAFFGVFADGSSGTGTITITQGTTVLATETVTFYGAVASFKATVKRNIAASSAATTAALDVIAYDANNVLVPSVGITVTSGTTATIGAFTETTSSAAEAKAGTAVVDVTGVTGKFGPVVLTIKDTATGLISTTATVNVGATEAKTVTAAFDKATYTPGELVTLTISALDANGVAVGDTASVATSYSILTNAAVQGTLPTAAEFKLGKQAITFYAPLVSGPLKAEITLLASAAHAAALANTKVTASATVGANTDISAITTLINSLIAKINALNKLVIKIQKKVRA